MNLLSTPVMKKVGRSIPLLLLLFASALPATAACCVANPVSSINAMHMAMPCCGDTCQIKKTAASRDHEITLAAKPSRDVPVAGVMMVIVAAAPAPATRAAAHECVSTDLSPPPPFLLNRQFRI